MVLVVFTCLGGYMFRFLCVEVLRLYEMSFCILSAYVNLWAFEFWRQQQHQHTNTSTLQHDSTVVIKI